MVDTALPSIDSDIRIQSFASSKEVPIALFCMRWEVPMRTKSMRWRLALALSILTSVAVSQTGPTRQVLSVNGRIGDAVIYRIDGKPYVDLEALVRIANGSISFQADRVILSIPGADQASSNSEPPALSSMNMSQAFMRDAVQTLTVLKDWTNILVYGIQRGVPGDGSRIVILRDRATEALRLTRISASSTADQNALQLLENHLNTVSSWSDRLVGERRRLDTAKYSMSQDGLKNDETFQKIDACTKFLSSMLPSGTFEDNYACH